MTCRLLAFRRQALLPLASALWNGTDWFDAHQINAAVNIHAEDPVSSTSSNATGTGSKLPVTKEIAPRFRPVPSTGSPEASRKRKPRALTALPPSVLALPPSTSTVRARRQRKYKVKSLATPLWEASRFCLRLVSPVDGSLVT